jgi:hypothetical protein
MKKIKNNKELKNNLKNEVETIDLFLNTYIDKIKKNNEAYISREIEVN